MISNIKVSELTCSLRICTGTHWCVTSCGSWACSCWRSCSCSWCSGMASCLTLGKIRTMSFELMIGAQDSYRSGSSDDTPSGACILLQRYILDRRAISRVWCDLHKLCLKVWKNVFIFLLRLLTSAVLPEFQFSDGDKLALLAFKRLDLPLGVDPGNADLKHPQWGLVSVGKLQILSNCEDCFCFCMNKSLNQGPRGIVVSGRASAVCLFPQL